MGLAPDGRAELEAAIGGIEPVEEPRVVVDGPDDAAGNNRRGWTERWAGPGRRERRARSQQERLHAFRTWDVDVGIGIGGSAEDLIERAVLGGRGRYRPISDLRREGPAAQVICGRRQGTGVEEST